MQKWLNINGFSFVEEKHREESENPQETSLCPRVVKFIFGREQDQSSSWVLE